MRVRPFFFTVLLIATELSIVVAQQREIIPENLPSPNATAFSVFGSIPVNLSTGVPNISIPIHEIKEGDFSLPITLNYHSSAVQPNSHPGWTGLGWSLLTGGVITRIQHGYADEHRMRNGTKLGYYYYYDRLAGSDWASDERLKSYAVEAGAHDLVEPPMDPSPDEFSFNFMGYSGKFMLGDDGKWKVSGTDKIQLIFDPLTDIIDGSKLGTSLNGDVAGTIKRPTTASYDNNYYYFNKFKLITPDGTTWEFGGFSATEYNTSYRNQAYAPLVSTSWFLTKIKTQDGKLIFLNYERGNMICSLAHHYSYVQYQSDSYSQVTILGLNIGSAGSGCAGHSTSIMRLPANGSLIFPVYLSSIETTFEKISFKRSASKELRYQSMDLSSPWDQVWGINFHYFQGHLQEPASDPTLELQWAKLEEIKITDRNDITVKSFQFIYTDDDQTRLKLKSLWTVFPNPPAEEEGARALLPVDIISNRYDFKYNDEPLPAYSSDQLDHWGYYNGNTYNPPSNISAAQWTADYPQRREPDNTGRFLRAELLNTIYYPTGGYSTFEFEPHNYTAVVNSNRKSLTNFDQNQAAGGVRIKTIKSYGNDGQMLLAKNYFYVKNYTGQADVSTLKSSGILGGRFQYLWKDYKGIGTDGNPISYTLFSSNSLYPSCQNTEGSHIGYSEAVERVVGNGYTKYYFSNFDTDAWGADHYDEEAENSIDDKTSIYFPYSSRAIERGYPQAVYVFNESDKPLSLTKTLYERSIAYPVKCTAVQHLVVCNVNASAQTWFGVAYYTYMYGMNKVRDEVTTWDTDNTGYSTTITSYHYNANNFPDIIKKIDSYGQEFKTEITYATDLSNGSTPTDAEANAINLMADPSQKYMINVPIETTEYYNGYVTQSSITTYTLQSTRIVPSAQYQAKFSPAVADYVKMKETGTGAATVLARDRCKLINKFSFDRYGKLKEAITEDGIATTYLWGYNRQFLIAKIVNATYQSLEDELGKTFLEQDNSSSPTFSTTLRNSVAGQKALITTYTYFPPRYGLTSVKDPNGFSTFYGYDNLYRLKTVVDEDRNIVKSFEYNFFKR
jgi:YD repeat-containing protein